MIKQRVKFLTSIASDNYSYVPGAETEIEANQAEQWRQSGILVFVATPIQSCPHCGGKLDDAVIETAAIVPPENAMKPKPFKRQVQLPQDAEAGSPTLKQYA